MDKEVGIENMFVGGKEKMELYVGKKGEVGGVMMR